MLKDTRHSVAEIDLCALSNNLLEIKKVAGNKKIIAVVKDDAYGHGAKEVIKKINNLVSYYGVANVKEGLLLKKYTKKPFIILGGFLDDEIKYFDNKLLPVVYDLESLRKLTRFEKKFKVHLEFDTGMGRTGILFNELSELEKILQSVKNIEIDGIMTHLACAESDEEFTRKQIQKFYDIIYEMKKRNISFLNAHISNSAGMFYDVIDGVNAVRPGIMIYGSYPSEKYKKLISLKPVMTLKSQIIYIKKVEKDTPISYGCTFRTKRKSVIATISAGYGDGYPRNLSNKGYVYIEKKGIAPVVGTVCMDMIMIDITDLKNVVVGDTVVLWGQGHDEVHPDNVAKRAETISYELFCHLPERVKKVYKNE